MEYYDTGMLCTYSGEPLIIRLALHKTRLVNASGQTIESAKVDVRPEGCEHFARCQNAGTPQCLEAVQSAYDLM